MSAKIPPLYALRAFDVAAKTCSFTRAAEEMNLTQSAISRHIKNLEDLLGYELFTRKGPKITLTHKGKAFSHALRKGFKQIEKACDLMQPDTKTLKIKTPTSLTSRWLLGPIQKFKSQNPDTNLLLSSVLMDLDEVDFCTEGFDCAILLSSGKFGKNQQGIKLFDELLAPICSQSFMHKIEQLEVAKLRSSLLIHPSHDRRDWQRWLSKFNYPFVHALEGGLTFDSLEQGINIALQGYGISIADISLINKEIKSGELIIPFKQVLRTGDAYYLVWPEDSNQIEIINLLAECLISSVQCANINKVTP